jgi:hypothetical protein
MARKQNAGTRSGAPHRQQSRTEARAARRKERRTRRILVGAVIAAGVFLAVAGIIVVQRGRDERIHDLADVGRGVPAVVQVHDITCPVCSELRANVRQVEGEFDPDTLVIRVADVATPEGLAFVGQYTDQRRVTLLFFDAEGELVDVQSGLQTPAELRLSFSAHVGR